MNCKKAKKLIPLYIEDVLDLKQVNQIEDHLSVCLLCCKEVEEFKQAWEMLGEIEPVSPSPDYVSRFWTEVSSRTSLAEKWKETFFGLFKKKQLVLAFSTLCVTILVVSSFWYVKQEQATDQLLTNLSADEVEMLDEIELANNFEIIENLDLLEDFDIIESIDSLKI